MASGYHRHPAQLNSLFGSDAELLRLEECGGNVIALTTDGIVEEIQQGLYSGPFLIGWMTVVASLSDLAAVGARPEGVLLQFNLPPNLEEAFLEGLQKGAEAACRACGAYVLGGDLNTAAQLSTAGTALGVIPSGKVLSRRGCREGNLLYTTAPLGLGTAFAFERVFGGEAPGITYQPKPRIKEGQMIRGFASACIDTSDGLIPGLSQLAFVNDIGFEISTSFSEALHPQARQLATQAGLPFWIMAAGPHGDFELLFTIPPELKTEFLEAARPMPWKPLFLGTVVEEGLVFDPGHGSPARTEAWQIANLFEEAGGQPQAYLESLMAFHQTLIQ